MRVCVPCVTVAWARFLCCVCTVCTLVFCAVCPPQKRILVGLSCGFLSLTPGCLPFSCRVGVWVWGWGWGWGGRQSVFGDPVVATAGAHDKLQLWDVSAEWPMVTSVSQVDEARTEETTTR